MKKLQIPENYKNILDVKRTENAIKLIKDHFQINLSSVLRLRRVTAPLFVLKGTGINDDLNGAFEISSMGIRVNRESMLEQLKIRGLSERKELYFHQKLLHDKLPLSIGGGIGQSRLCMFYLRKAHIGEVQASVWPDEMRKKCGDNNIQLL